MKARLGGFLFLLSLTALPAGAAVPVKTPAELVKEIKVEQRLNAALPLEASFRDETGKPVLLKDYFGGNRPVILSLAYFKCPMLCSLVINGMVDSLRTLTFNPGKEFDLITVSFDPKDTPPAAQEKKKQYLKRYNRRDAENHWAFLTGGKASIDALTQTLGFQYVEDPVSGQFAHASALFILTPDGKIARYFFGIDYSAKDIRFALVEASKGKIGNLADYFLMLCFHYDDKTGKYGLAIMNVMRLGGILTLGALLGYMITMFRQDKLKR